uniref:DUF2796 domain-containing protein n=1 Tax=Marinobacterium profundum TaxID=1714300 RepID=UPI0009E6A6E6|nr:DUF2796 domain-containing protein [Marinobacterium profundum]
MSVIKGTGAKRRFVMATVVAMAAGTGMSHAAEFEQQYDGHAHGVAQLDLVLDGSELMLQLYSPAMNLVGFEHRARSASERQAVDAALEGLHQAEQMIKLDAAAGCTLRHAEVTQALLDTEERSETAEHGHAEEHAHEDEHDHTRAHEPEGQGEAGRAHTDFEVSYAFHCTAPEKLTSIGLAFFARFPGLETLDVRMITADGQRALTLDSHNIDIGLR